MGKKKRFLRQLKIEMEKALKNKMFLITLVVGMILTFLAGLYQISAYEYVVKQELPIGSNPMVEAYSLYNKWIGGEMQSFGAICFFYLFPFLAALPYGWICLTERKTGYNRYLMIRGGKKEYYLCKYIAVFLTGGLVILIPLVFNFLMVAMFVPAVQPDAHYTIYYAVDYGTMWSSLFYHAPLLYDILYILLDFLFAGLFACMSMACALILKNKIAVMILPYFIILALHYARTFCYYRIYQEISPLNYLAASSVENVTTWWIVLIEAVLFAIIPIGIIKVIGKQEIM